MDSTNTDKLDYTLLNKYCFQILEYALNNVNPKPKPPEFPKEFVGKSYPIFVTWKKGPYQDLRGCIGTFSSQKLEKCVKEYALISAFQDERFEPIEKKEIPSLSCGVSLLTQFEDCKNPSDWEVGKHGIEIDFEENGFNYGATFLPEVAKEEEWDQMTTLRYLVRKAGYKGKLEKVYNKIKTKRYQSIKCNLTYDEYKAKK